MWDLRLVPGVCMVEMCFTNLSSHFQSIMGALGQCKNFFGSLLEVSFATASRDSEGDLNDGS